MFTHYVYSMINAMIIVLLFFGWLSFLIYGTILVRASKHRKTGITLITLFFLAPIAFMASGVWMVVLRIEECRLLGIEVGCIG